MERERDDFSFVLLAQPLATINTFVVRIVELNSLIFFFSVICLKLRSELIHCFTFSYLLCDLSIESAAGILTLVQRKLNHF